MPPIERWTEIQAVLATVLELPEEQRAARIAALCGEDVELREAVERLLRACTAADAEGFLDDLIDYASPVIADLERSGETAAGADELRDRLTLALEHRYRIERALGSGGMATVFLARDLRHERQVAVKVMQPGLLAGASAERFLREIRIVANLTHPHILPLHDSGQAAGLLYHVSAYIGGESLRARLRRDGALPVRDALRITREVATALDYAHRQGIVHRDIKPENVLIQDGHAVVADFGIARAFGHALGENSGGEATAITHEGLRLGTPAYMAPEQVTGSSSADHRADLYALGLVAHEMLTGTHPFAGSTAEELMVAQLARVPDRLERPDIPPALADVVLRLLEKRPDDRFQTAEQLLAELEQITLQPAPAGRTPAMNRAVPLGRSPAATGSGSADLRPRRKRAFVAVAVALPVLALLIALTARFGFDRGRSGGSAAVPLSDRTVAVAAFPGSSGAVNEEVDRVLRMAADWMGLGLMQTGLVTVVPIGALASGSDGAAGADATTLGAARAAGAGLVLLPSFHHVRDTVFLSARILRVSDGVMLRTAGPVTASLDAPLEGAEALRQRVTAALATLIDDRLANWSSGASQPTSFEAYQMFAEGLTAFFEPGQSRDPYPYFRRAHQLDTTFTAPLAWAFFVGGGGADDSIKQYLQSRRSRLPPWDRGLLDWATRQNDEEGYQAFRRVVESAPQSEWLYMLAWTAEETNRSAVAVRALESLDPDRGWMRYWPSYWWLLANSHHDLGQHEQELASARQMRTRFPWAPFLTTEARALAALGRTDELVHALAELGIDDSRTSVYDAGRQFARLILELRRHGYPELAARFTDRVLLELESMEGRGSREQLDELRMFILGAANRWVEAAPVLERLSVDRPGGHRVLYFRARAAAFRGERAAAERLAQEARDLHLQRASRPQIVEGNYLLMLSTVNAMLGDRERAVALLKSAGGDRILPEYLHIQTGLESLIGYPPFDELASRRYDDPDFMPIAGAVGRKRQVRAR